MTREELIALAERVGVVRPRVLTLAELTDEILSRTARSDRDRARARGWLGRARDLLAGVVERGLHLPDVAQMLRTTPSPQGWPPAPPPLATLTLAEIYAAQGHLERAVTVLDEVLEGRVVRETMPDGGAARRLPEAERRWHVTLGQLLAVGLGARLAGFLSGKHFVTDVAPLLEQLGRSLAPGDRRRLRRLEEKIVVIGTGQKDVRRRPEVQVRLATMVEGLLLEREVEVGYLSHNRRSRGEAPRGLRVHPLALVLHRGGVYFVVDIVAGDWPTPPARVLLALDRIGAATATEVPFDLN